MLKFPEAGFDSLRVSWAQLLGAEPWGATRMHMVVDPWDADAPEDTPWSARLGASSPARAPAARSTN